MVEFPPGLILIVGAFALAATRGLAFRALALILPALTLAAVWLTTDQVVQIGWLGQALTLVQKNAPTMVFATIFSVMTLVGALFALNMERRVELPAAFIYAGSAINVTFAGDLLTMFIFWELMAVGSTVVIWSAGTAEAAASGRRYVNVHLVGGAVMMAGLALHFANTGSLQLTNLSNLDDTASVLILLGILINAAAPPFGSWLPDAYPAASASGTVFLSAFTTKTAVYVLMVLFAGTKLLIWIGCGMAIYGIVYAILENDMRRILAYSIVNQVGFMVCGIGIGTQMALNGAAAHAFAHIIYKALLLMSSGSVLYMTGKRKCTELGGLYRTMPLTMICGTIGALAISSFPATSGFTTKSMITEAAAHEHLQTAWLILEAASAGVFLHAGIKFPWFVFFQRDSGLRPPDPPLNMKAAMVLFAAACLGIGLYPEPLYAILPFPQAGHDGPDGLLYHAYTAEHLIYQFQLLLFAGFAFFALLKVLKRTETITLDADWTYRTMFPRIWVVVLAPFVRWTAPAHVFFVATVPTLTRKFFTEDPFGVPPHLVRKRLGVGPTVALLTVFLAVVLVLNLL